MQLYTFCVGTILIVLILCGLSQGFFFSSIRSAPRSGDAASLVKETVSVDLGDRSYPIYIDNGLIGRDDIVGKHIKSKKVLIVTNTLVGPLYLAQVQGTLEKRGIEFHSVILPDGEEYKDMANLMKIIDGAMDCKLDRKSTLLALGGGVVGDMTGFAAAIYQRGIRFVQMPTTVMAMVDSAVGGKTAINHEKGKNMVGAFYQPEAVIADIDTLSSLPDREFNSGLAEVIKYGLIRDQALFRWLEENMDRVMGRENEALRFIIKRSCELKAEIVAADEKEEGIRALLNLGHTFGHAIEAGFGYGCWLHGEAVAAGTVMAAQLSAESNLLSFDSLIRIKKLMSKAKLPVALCNEYAEKEVGKEKYEALRLALTPERFLDYMSIDKKVADGKLSLILLEEAIGNALITSEYDVKKLREVVTDFCVSRSN